MSAKIRNIFIFLMLMVDFSMIEAAIDCMGKSFFCTTDNTYLSCYYDEIRNTTVTVEGRSELCPTGILCDMSSDSPCLADCGGKEFLCPSINSYILCEVQLDGSSRTTSNEVKFCPDGTYCDHIYGQFECDSPVIPDPSSTNADSSSTTTEIPITETSITEELTSLPTEASTTEVVTTLPTEASTTEVVTTLPTEASTTEVVTTLPTEASSTTTQVTTTAAPSLGELPGYTCPRAGLFPHPTDCRRYIYCYIAGSTYRNRQLQCVNELVYHPELGGCTTNTDPCENLIFKCVEIGRFADPVNPNKYIWCLKVNGGFHQLKYSCPAGKIYNGKDACVEPIIINAIETFALSGDDPVNVYSTSRRSLSFQNKEESDEERYEESDEMLADQIYLNSNEDASVYNRGEVYSKL